MTVKQKLEVRKEIQIDASPETVWQVMISPEGIAKWLGPDEYEAELGGKINFLVTMPDHKEFMFGEVVTFDPPNTFAFTWTQQTLGGDTWETSTLVTLTLEAKNKGTHVVLVHSGFENLPEAIANVEHEGYTHGWSIRPVLERLKTAVESK